MGRDRLPNLYKGSLKRILKGLVLLCWLGLIFFPAKSIAKNDPVEDFYEILIYVQLSKFGGIEIPAVIREESAFLSATDLFDFLQIKNTISEESVMEGFVLNQDDKFTIDPIKETLLYQGEEHVLLSEAIIEQDGLLYLNSSIYGEIFGLNCSFNYRSLSVSLSTELDLPVLRLKRQEMLRKNLNQLQKNATADTAFQLKNSLVGLSMLDWQITNTQQLSPGKEEYPSPRNFNQSRMNLSLGGELAYGEFNAKLNFIEGMPVRHRNQFYQWRYVNNDQALAKQIIAGRINTQATSTLYAPVTGIQVTNAATLKKKSFGSYRISDHTEPEWVVELYVNDLLIDYVQADATGFYSFEIPLMYGSSAIQLKFYGPHGEEQSSEQFLNIPFNFLPKNETEYTLSAGLMEDGKGRLFSRGSLNYGLSNQVTLGGGVEYVSSLADQPFMPFVHSSVRVADGLLFSGDYMPGVRSKALINYRLPSSLQLDVTYTKLEEGQKAIFYNYLEERKVALSMPIKANNFSLFSRFSLSQTVYPTSKFTNAQLLLSSMLFGVNTQVSTFGTFRGNNSSNLQTLISQTHRLPGNISFIPQLQYNYSAKQISLVMAKLDKRVFNRGYLNVFYQNNLLYKSTSFGVGFRYDFSFANTSMQVRQSNDHTIFTQSVNGSFMIDGNTGHVGVNNKVNVGKGAITVLPFLDLNANGKRDKEESLVAGLKLKTKGGQVHYDKRGESIRITNLMAYEDYILELDKSSFDNIAWRIKNAIIKVSVNPNQFRKVEVPISVMGEAAGMVYFGEELNGIGRIKMNFYDDRDNFLHSVLTENDGYFSYMELAPGKYRVMPDSVQMQQLGYTFQSGKTTFIITENEEGEYLDDLEITLHKIISEPAIQDSLHIVNPIYSEELKVGMDRKGEFAQEEEGILADNNNEASEKNDPIPAAALTEEPQQDTFPQDENVVIDQLKEKSKQAVSLTDSMNALRFTLKNSNPALLQNLIGKSLEEQKQAVKTFVEKPTGLPDDSPSGTKGRPREDTAQLASGVIYKIQVMASELELPLDHPYFKGTSNISKEYHDGFYKYTHLPTSSPTEAQENLKKMISLGFKDVFVAEYQEGKRLENGKSTHSAPTDGIMGRTHPDTHFKIQIRSSDEMLRHDDPVFKGVKEIDFYIHKGQYKYTYGVALNYQEAVVLLGHVRSLGFDDAFIVSFYKKRRLE